MKNPNRSFPCRSSTKSERWFAGYNWGLA